MRRTCPFLFLFVLNASQNMYDKASDCQMKDASGWSPKLGGSWRLMGGGGYKTLIRLIIQESYTQRTGSNSRFVWAFSISSVLIDEMDVFYLNYAHCWRALWRSCLSAHFKPSRLQGAFSSDCIEPRRASDSFRTLLQRDVNAEALKCCEVLQMRSIKRALACGLCFCSF